MRLESGTGLTHASAWDYADAATSGISTQLPHVRHTGGDGAAVRNLRLFFIDRRKLYCAVPQTALPLLQKGPVVQEQERNSPQPQNGQRDDDRPENDPTPHDK